MCARERGRLALYASLCALLLLAIGRAQSQDIPMALDKLRQIEQLLPTLTLSLNERGQDLTEREKLSMENVIALQATEEALKATELRLTEREASLNWRESAISEREALTYERASDFDSMETALQLLSDSYKRLSTRYSLAKWGLIGLTVVSLAEGIAISLR